MLEIMKLFGMGTRVAILNSNKLILILILILFSTEVFAKDCIDLKNSFLNLNNYTDIGLLEEGVAKDDLCLKNLMGVMIYRGIYFQKDEDRAEKIFYDLSNKKFPESQFNFALVLTKKKNQKPEDIIFLLLGIYSSYIEDRSNSHIASLARDLGRQFIQNLTIPLDKKSEIETKFEDAIKTSQFNVAQNRFSLVRVSREKFDTFMTFVSLGALAYGVGSSLNSPAPYNPQWHMTPTTNIGNIYSFH